MASVYRIRKEERTSGVRYVVDYRDNTGRRSTRRFKRSHDADAFKKQVEASTYTGLLPRPRPCLVGPMGRGVVRPERSPLPGRQKAAPLDAQ